MTKFDVFRLCDHWSVFLILVKMTECLKKFTCINCGEPVKELYKIYSASVLKLTNCQHCQNVADKYVEYDNVITIIDLVLLRKEAYRHVLCNTDFKFHWKLALLLHVIEAYYEYSVSHASQKNSKNFTTNFKEFTTGDLIFYKICALLCLRTFCFFLIAYVLTVLYNRQYGINKNLKQLLIEMWKCITLSSFGIFLFLPSLIWGSETVQDYNLSFVVFYTTMSQLFAYRVANNCSKLWSIFVIMVSHFISKLLTLNYVMDNYIDVLSNTKFSLLSYNS